MNKAAAVQVRQRLEQLAKHVEHYARLLVGTHLHVDILAHELLNGVTTRFHFYLGNFVGVHETKNSRHAFYLWEKVVFADYFLKALWNAIFLYYLGTFFLLLKLWPYILLVRDTVDEKLEHLKLFNQRLGTIL